MRSDDIAEGAAVKAGLPVRSFAGFAQSALILGAAQLGGAYGIANVSGQPDQAGATRLLRLAVGLGVTHVDTARAYGDSEHRIGAAGVADLDVITKVAPLRPEQTGTPEAAAAAVAESVRASGEALGARRLTLLMHRAADALAAGGAGWTALRELRAAGIAPRIGVSVQSPAELLQVAELPELGYLQLPCNILDRRWLAPEVSRALENRPDVVVTVRSVYLQGLLAAGTAVRWPHLADERRNEVVAILDGLAAELGRADRADLCVGYVLSLPWVASVVIGAEAEGQLRANAELAGRPPLTVEERRLVLTRLPELPVDLLDPSRWSGA